MSNNQIYDAIPEGYYYYAFKRGNSVQKFWHKQKFSEIINLMDLKNKKILDIGCGPGVLLSLLPEDYESATGLDLSKKQINFAKKQFKNLKKINWISKDFKEMDFKEKFDYIIIAEFLEHITYQDSIDLLKKTKNLLAEDGKLIITTPNYKSFWPLIELVWNKMAKVSYEDQHINPFTRSKMKKTLKETGFNNINIKTFFIISPFTTILSKSIAKIILKIEKKILPSAGSMMVIQASTES